MHNIFKLHKYIAYNLISVDGKYTKYIYIYYTPNLNTHLHMGKIFFSSYAM